MENNINTINNNNNKRIESDGSITLAIVIILLLFSLLIAHLSSDNDNRNNVSSNTSTSTQTISLNRTIENKIENYGYKVTGFMNGKKTDEYFCYINGDVSVINLSSTKILVNIYYDDLTLKDSFTISR